MNDEPDLRDLVAELHAHLEATEELDIDHRANRWLGEAQAVTADIAGEDLPAKIITNRVAHVGELLEQVGETQNPVADEHIRAALVIVAEIEGRS